MLVLGRDYLLSAPVACGGHTGRVGDNASLPYFFQSYLFYQMSDRMESTSGLESTDALIVLAFEEEIETRSWLPIPRRRS